MSEHEQEIHVTIDGDSELGRKLLALSEGDREAALRAFAGLVEQLRRVPEPEELLEASRPEDSPLHPLFEWDDAIAARKYREHQARERRN